MRHWKIKFGESPVIHQIYQSFPPPNIIQYIPLIVNVKFGHTSSYYQNKSFTAFSVINKLCIILQCSYHHYYYNDKLRSCMDGPQNYYQKLTISFMENNKF